MEKAEVCSDPLEESVHRRAMLALLGTGLLAGCASRPVAPSVASEPTPQLAFPRPRMAGSLDFNPDERNVAVAQAMLLVNTPYTYGGNTPQGGFDCSGLISYVFLHVTRDRRLPRTTAQWAAATAPVGNRPPEPGDLVFFNTTGRPNSHMGLYVGRNEFVHAPATGGRVHQTSLSNIYFARRYDGARSAFAA